MLRLNNSYFCVNGSLTNRDDPRYIRILWLDNTPDWDRVTVEQAIIYSKSVDYQNDPALMLDNTMICLS